MMDETRHLSKNNMAVFTVLAALLTGILTHGYAFFNMLYSHDCMIVYQDDDVWQVSLGRFLMPVYAVVRGRYYPPSVVGVLGLLFIGLSAFLIIKMFNVKNPVTIFLITAIMTTNSTVSLLTASFIHDLDAYMLALLLSVLAVYLWSSCRFGFFVSILCLVLSAGLYPAYIQVSVLIFLVLAVRDLVNNKPCKTVIKQLIFEMICVAVSCGIYYFAAQTVARVKGVEFSQSGNALGSVEGYDYFGSMPALIGGMYKALLDIVIKPLGANSYVKCGAFILLAFFSAVLLIWTVKARKVNGVNLLFAGLICLILPAGCNCIYLISHGFFHDLMMYSDHLIFVFVLITFDKCLTGMDESSSKKVLKTAVPIICALIITDNFIYAGNIYLHKDMAYQATTFTMTRVIDRLEQMEGYYPGAPVAIVGDIERASLNYVRDEYFKMTGNGAHFYTTVNYYRLYERYFQKLLGYPIYILPGDEAYRMQEIPQVKQMPAFPAQGCISQIDGVFVIRISETDIDISQVTHK